MVLFALVIAVNILVIPYILTPILWLLGVPVPEFMDVPQEVWNLIQIGLGGYIAGRSGEKIMKSYKDK